MRAALRASLPNAPGPDGQMVRNNDILHTTIARLLQPPGAAITTNGTGHTASEGGLSNSSEGGVGDGASSGEQQQQQAGGSGGGVGSAAAVQAAVEAVSRAVCGLRVQLSELWYVQEMHVLALALRGQFTKHRAPLVCPAQR